MFANVRCSPKMFAYSAGFLTPSPPAEKASAREDDPRGDIVERVRSGVAYEAIPVARDVARV
jgi:hypothetical protein